MDRVPRSLENLIRNTVKDDPNPNLETLSTTINDNFWTQKFNNYLKARGMEDGMNSLRFLLALQILETSKDLKKKHKNSLFSQILREFFEDNPLPLSNSKLFDKVAEIPTENEFSEENLALLIRVKNDPSIWHEGLEPVYLKFLSSLQPQNAVIACLLSIL